MSLAIVVSGGTEPDLGITRRIPVADVVIAADSGFDHARALGLVPTVLIGDLDSISAAGLAWAETNGVEIHRYPPDKNMTDLELALADAAARVDEVVVIDSGKGRFDHAYANITLLSAHRYSGLTITALVDGATISVVRSSRVLFARAGQTVSLFCVGGRASGVTTTGMRWDLSDATLEPGSTWGVSNELIGAEGRVSVTDGVVLAIQVDPF